MTQRRSNRLRWTLGIIVFVVASAYALGGASSFRQARRRIAQWMEPPTQAQMQRAVVNEAVQAAADSVARADTAGHRSDPPASGRFILTIFGIAFGAVAAALLASIRWSAHSREDR